MAKSSNPIPGIHASGHKIIINTCTGNGVLKMEEGDFSKGFSNKKNNFNGSLYQQGRVFLDSDFNDQTKITIKWQDLVAKDTVGPGVAAIPADNSSGFKVTEAKVDNGNVKITLVKGRAWTDGLLVYSHNENENDLDTRIATYLQQPIQDLPFDPSSIKNTVRDAVILEVWREAVNAFQIPDELLELALGGPDTTERIFTASALRLLRLNGGEISATIKGTWYFDIDTCSLVRNAVMADLWWEQVDDNTRYLEPMNGAKFTNLGIVDFDSVVDPSKYVYSTSKIDGSVNNNTIPAGTVLIAQTHSGKYFKILIKNYGYDLNVLVAPLSESQSMQVQCCNLANNLQGDNTQKGKLTVTLQATQITNCDCPVVKAGGFTGFEHGLYRIEIADVNDNTSRFKWSQFNGGLVGRGHFDPNDNSKIIITGNLQAIKTSGLDSFYLEIVEYKTDLGHWEVTYGTTATLVNDELQVPKNPAYVVAPGPSQGDVFFRLWNDIQPISDYTKAKELTDGIILQFDDPSNSLYLPRDYWTFPVRVGEVKIDPLINNEPPYGITYHRVPLAILNWNDAKDVVSPEGIDDCRKIFRPLTNLNTCCTFTVGDGKTTFGDFDSISDAIANLPNSGGEICLLSGMHQTNAVINSKSNMKIKGCGNDTKISPQDVSKPIFSIIDCSNISIENISFVAQAGKAIFLHGTDVTKLEDIQIYQNTFYVRDYAILALSGTEINIHDNEIYMVDQPNTGVAIYISATDSKIEENLIYAKPHGQNNPSLAVGGIQIASGSNGIKIRQNKINGGQGNGITLNSSNFILETDETFTSFLRNVDQKMYDITIQDNEIINMGLAGIGSNLYRKSRDLNIVNPVNNLRIHHNQITNCMWYFSELLSRIVLELKRGFGGITLDHCEDVSIIGNRIENNGNGSSRPIPMCGICLSYTNHANIAQNYISNNCTMQTKDSYVYAFPLPSGIRGGIVIYSTSLPTNCPMDNNELISEEIPAVWVHDNVVNQPIGQALHVTALGSVSVQNNRFNSEYNGPLGDQDNWENGSEGSVYILNMGKPRPTGSPIFDALFISTQSNLPDGNILFEGNQIRLGPNNQSASSIWIVTSDDIGFIGNQSDCLNTQLQLHCSLDAVTIRATDNRFKETKLEIVSLFTRSSMMNITANNQGDNCIHVINTNPNPNMTTDVNNQVLTNPNCKQSRDVLATKFGSRLPIYNLIQVGNTDKAVMK
jgi:hypothetical protein